MTYSSEFDTAIFDYSPFDYTIVRRDITSATETNTYANSITETNTIANTITESSSTPYGITTSHDAAD